MERKYSNIPIFSVSNFFLAFMVKFYSPIILLGLRHYIAAVLDNTIARLQVGASTILRSCTEIARPLFFLCHWVGRKKGLVQFESHNCLDTSRSYATIMHLVHLNSVIIGYINNRFSVSVDQPTIYH